MSKQRTKQPKQQTKQNPLYDHQYSALFDEMTADEALIAQSEATTQAWIKHNAKIAEGAVDEINELDEASKSETLASEESLVTTIEQLRASLEERDQLLREKDKQISDLTRDYRHVTEVNIQLEKRLQRLDEENEGLKQDKSDLRDTILILKQSQVEKTAKLEEELLVIKQPEYDILKSQFDSIQKHEDDQDSPLLGVDNSEID
jgi:chromosome segregation ATPase